MSCYHFDYLPLLFLSLVHYYYYYKNILFWCKIMKGADRQQYIHIHSTCTVQDMANNDSNNTHTHTHTCNHGAHTLMLQYSTNANNQKYKCRNTMRKREREWELKRERERERKRGGGDQGSLYEHLSQIVKFGLLLHWQLGQLQSKREGVRNPIRRRQTHYFLLLLSKSAQRNSFPYVLLY